MSYTIQLYWSWWKRRKRDRRRRSIEIVLGIDDLAWDYEGYWCLRSGFLRVKEREQQIKKVEFELRGIDRVNIHIKLIFFFIHGVHNALIFMTFPTNCVIIMFSSMGLFHDIF